MTDREKVANAIKSAMAYSGTGDGPPTTDDMVGLAMDELISGNGGSLDPADCHRLVIGLDGLTRDNGHAYVHDGFRREERRTPLFKVEQGLRESLVMKGMNDKEKSVLASMLEVRVAGAILAGKPAGTPYPFKRP